MSGYATELEAGLDWVLDRHLSQPEPRKPSVVTMSLILSSRSSASVLIAEKVEEMIENGIIVVAAAGNFHDGQFILHVMMGYANITEQCMYDSARVWHNTQHKNSK